MQLSRPSIKKSDVGIKYILFSDLHEHCDALCKFGDNHKILEKIAKGDVVFKLSVLCDIMKEKSDVLGAAF